MANVTITELPAAGSIAGDELVPIVQNGVTVHTTTAAIAASPSQTQTFLTKNNESTLPNSRYLSTDGNLTLVDGGALSYYRVGLTGAAASLNTASTGFMVKDTSTTVVNRSIASGTTGISVANGTGVSGNPTLSLTGLPLSLANASGTGLLTIQSGTSVTPVSIVGTANEIQVTNGSAAGGSSPTVGLAQNPVIPGVQGMKIPAGLTSDRSATPSNGMLRYNTTAEVFEGYANGAWGTMAVGTGVSSVGTGTGLTGGPITSTGTISIASTAVTAGSYGSSSQVPSYTVNAQGQLTAAANIAISATAIGAVTAVTGTVNEITSSGGQTPAISLPSALTFTGKTITGGTMQGATINTASTIDGSVIGGVTPAAATFTSADVDYVDFNTSATVARATGRLWWDNTDGIQTLNLGMAGSNATMQVGEEIYYRIKASAAITDGQAVMFTGTVGASGALTGAPATGLTSSTASYFMGVATESIALNGWGYITHFGLVRGINTSGGAEAWVDGEILYYNPAVTGGLTKTVPVAPTAKIQVAVVVNASSGGSGSLFVRPTNGGRLGQFEGDVEINGVTANDFLVYGSGSRWENKTPANARTALGAGSANGLATLDSGGTVPTSQLPAAVLGALKYQGTWNATTNTPTLASGVGTQGHYYVVSVAGTTNLDGITDWKIGDWAIYSGTAWQKIDNTDAVTSVNSYTGTVVLSYSDVGAQPLDSGLTDIAGLAVTDGNFIVGDGTNWIVESGSTARASLGLGSIATQAASSIAITGGTIDGTIIGATTAAAGTFTTITATSGISGGTF